MRPTRRAAVVTAMAVALAGWGGARRWQAAGQQRKRPAPAVVALRDAAPNTWARIAHSDTGRRPQPVFVYAGQIKRFVMASGQQSTGGGVPRHYDTEEFDLAGTKWVNAYPPSLAAGRPESGPVGEKYARSRVKHGSNGWEGLFYKDGGRLRVGAGGQWLKTRCGFEHCYDSDSGKVYLYLHDVTARYDPATRTWEDMRAPPRTSCRLWGAMCYDPVNKEILHAGGDGGSAEIGTWAYSIEKNEWHKLAFDRPVLAGLHARADAVIWHAKVLLAGAINRFTVVETPAEAKADLAAEAAAVAEAAGKLAGGVRSARASEADKAAFDAAGRRLDAAVTALKAVASKLGGAVTPKIIADLRTARVLLEQAADALAVEPPGRARSQIAYDGVHRKIVLFGGDQLDRTLSDTWLYDCSARTWHQQFPATCPPPRAGHVLAWLPKARLIVLAGGYSRVPLPQEVWTYDVAANQWKRLLHVPLGKENNDHRRFSPGCPRVDARTVQNGAVNDDDVLVCPSSMEHGLDTYACRIDPAAPAEGADNGPVAASGDYTFNRIDPARWEQAAAPDHAAAKAALDALPPNQWTAVKFPLYAPGARNRWGTTAYDVDRHQLLFWGGGHATSHENDVAHYSVLGNCWTIGYHPDDPIEIVYASQPTPLSFHDRMHVPIHAYKAYCYDPTVHQMLYFDRAYDPAVREWVPKPYAGLAHRGPMHSQMEPTPAGAVVYSDRGLFRLDAKAGRYAKLPWTGPKPEGIWCDGDSLLYDSKRDCLYLTNRKELFRYDIATGKGEKLNVALPKVLGRFHFHGEEVYLPDADLVLLMNLFPRANARLANVAWDPKTMKFYWVDLKYADRGKEVTFTKNPFRWHTAQRYDPALKLVLLNNSSAAKVWIMRFDSKAAHLEEIKASADTRR